MKIIACSLLCILRLSVAVIPLSSSPTWTSSENDYSTGGALYDVTMDGLIDFCMGNGNDMASNFNAVYVNHAGVLENIASWRSLETGYYSHIYIGDVDNDGDPDMAVSYLGAGGGNQGPTSIYRNTGTGLGSTTWWTSNDQYNSFDCAFGDVDLDGDLDLAVAAGDAYSTIKSPTRVYRNNSGTIETNPYWTSVDSTPGDACRWVDLDNDGYLDLVVGYRRKLAAFRNINGTLELAASWSTNEPGWILRIAVGDYNKDGYKDIAVACNGQLSGDASRIEVYRNNNGTLQTPPQYVMLSSTDYCSCVEWGDANNDTWLDLAGGGWWEPAVVFENNSGTINTTPSWSWNGGSNLVCEAVTWGDVDNSSVITITDYRSGNGTRKLFYFSRHPIQHFQEVRVDNFVLPLSDFTYDPLTGWITLKNAPASGTNNIEIKYSYARYPDLGLTNWDPPNGNYLFSNTITGIEETEIVDANAGRLKLDVYPNPFDRQVIIKPQITDPKHQANTRVQTEIEIFDAAGNLIKSFGKLPLTHLLNYQIKWDGTDDGKKPLPSGVYFIRVRIGSELACEKVVLTR